MNKLGLVLVGLSCAIWLCIHSSVCSGSDLRTSWKLVEDELSVKGITETADQFWTNSATLRRLAVERRVSELLEMAGQRELTGVRFGSYFALRSLDHGAALDVGLNIVLTTRITNLLVGVVLQTLVKDVHEPSFGQALGTAFRTVPVDKMCAATLVNFLPYDYLAGWFEDQERPAVRSTYEAIVVQRLHAEMARLKLMPSARMKSAIAGYADVPGVPRVVYVGLGDEKSPRFREALKLCLEDENLEYSQISAMVVQRAHFIDENIDLAHLNIRAERLSRLKSDLTKGLEFAPSPR